MVAPEFVGARHLAVAASSCGTVGLLSADAPATAVDLFALAHLQKRPPSFVPLAILAWELLRKISWRVSAFGLETGNRKN